MMQWPNNNQCQSALRHVPTSSPSRGLLYRPFPDFDNISKGNIDGLSRSQIRKHASKGMRLLWPYGLVIVELIDGLSSERGLKGQCSRLLMNQKLGKRSLNSYTCIPTVLLCTCSCQLYVLPTLCVIYVVINGRYIWRESFGPILQFSFIESQPRWLLTRHSHDSLNLLLEVFFHFLSTKCVRVGIAAIHQWVGIRQSRCVQKDPICNYRSYSSMHVLLNGFDLIAGRLMFSFPKCISERLDSNSVRKRSQN